MTCIVARAGTDSRPDATVATLQRSLAAMVSRGAEPEPPWVGEALGFGAARHEWEQTSLGSGSAISHRGACAVVADATLYYRDDLVRAIEGRSMRVGAHTAAELILAAYEAVGDDLTGILEGDYAFVLWDGARRRLLAARDFGGKRPLYFSAEGGEIMFASTVGGVVADARVRRELDLASIAMVASGMWCYGEETCYRAVRELRGGHRLVWEPNQPVVTEAFWRAPERIAMQAPDDDAAPELLRLLANATRERLAVGGATAVTLSGGWDSTAVFGAAHYVLRDAPGERSIRAVSMSYPEGDPGCEDDFIAETAAFWDGAPTWLRIDDVPMFTDVVASGRERDEPWAHPFEHWNRALSRGAAGTGARVLLDGFGGDQLFQVSDVYLADLLRAGRWIELARQWRTREAHGLRAFLRLAVRPGLSPATIRRLARIRGMSEPGHHLDRTPPPWIRRGFLRAHGVMERERAARPALPTGSAVLAEAQAFLRFPNFPRMSGRIAGFGLAEGVEHRSPLLDERVVRFAVPRPWSDRVNGRETKILLRRSMRGLLPERVLAPRPHRTGVTTGYFTRALSHAGGALVSAMAGGACLADLGVVNLDTLQRAWEYFLRTADSEIGLGIYFTLQAEHWLRAHEGVPSASVHQPVRASIPSA